MTISLAGNALRVAMARRQSHPSGFTSGSMICPDTPSTLFLSAIEASSVFVLGKVASAHTITDAAKITVPARRKKA